MSRTLIAIGLAVLVGLAGCSAITGGDDATATPGVGIDVADDETGATDVNQTLRIEVDESTSGSELTAVGATYPRDRFVVDSAAHEAVDIGVDTTDDVEVDRTFNESHVSGVNNNAYSVDITLETGYTLEEGDVVVVGYPAVDNPDEPGDYDVDVRLNDAQNATSTVTIE